MVTRTRRLVRYSSRCDDSSPVNSRGSARMVFLLVGLLCFMLILGGCEFFGSNLFPMYLGFTDATFDVRGIVRETYPNARGFDIRQAKFARYIVDNVDYSKVIVFVEVFEQGRLLLFLDPVSLRPVRVVDESILSSWGVSTDVRIDVTHRGFVIGNALIDPRGDLGALSGQYLVGILPEDILVQIAEDGQTINNPISLAFRSNSNTLNIDEYGVGPGNTPLSISWDISDPILWLLDAVLDQNRRTIRFFVELENGNFAIISISDVFALLDPVTPSVISLSPEIERIRDFDFSNYESQRSLWLTQNRIVTFSRYGNNRRGGTLTTYLFDGSFERELSISTYSEQMQVFDIDKGFNNRSEWWLLYDRNTGLLYKNRIWWSQ